MRETKGVTMLMGRTIAIAIMPIVIVTRASRIRAMLAAAMITIIILAITRRIESGRLRAAAPDRPR
ncbi:putative membrane protein [Bradyrhizobium sp. USDA 3315]